MFASVFGRTVMLSMGEQLGPEVVGKSRSLKNTEQSKQPNCSDVEPFLAL